MSSLLYIAGQILQRTMESPDIGNLERSFTTATLDGGRDVRISYLRSGGREYEGEIPLVYIHGTPGDATNFLSFVRSPVANYPSIAIDRPGFGKSTSKTFVSFADQARAVIAVLDDLHVEKAILVGHSLGGPIIARAAADFPERVAAIVELAGSLDPDLEELKWYNTLLRWWPVTVLLPRSFICSNEEVLAAREQCELLAPVLKDVRCPVMIVHGTHDRLVPYENVAYMEREFSGAQTVELRRLEGADHFLPWAQEAELRRAIKEVLGWVGDSATTGR